MGAARIVIAIASPAWSAVASTARGAATAGSRSATRAATASSARTAWGAVATSALGSAPASGRSAAALGATWRSATARAARATCAGNAVAARAARGPAAASGAGVSRSLGSAHVAIAARRSPPSCGDCELYRCATSLGRDEGRGRPTGRPSMRCGCAGQLRRWPERPQDSRRRPYRHDCAKKTYADVSASASAATGERGQLCFAGTRWQHVTAKRRCCPLCGPVSRHGLETNVSHGLRQEGAAAAPPRASVSGLEWGHGA
mmetsp:Transcript_89555/g.252377  ORF Transcript_89555/g.252377 Transcript_89555/m.252377 type:complete len:260 (-) Transcript_89555:76-855(-)